ncbi:protein FAM217B isoform X2 [Sturnira hondurensis]|uniref:protein FAM217B isoform X2 n=1 Tax=Sturnira hondurensis TaxID=192404 RepID=UPI00187A206D|nr:protein FAM217B isoform X2 [Sturnira hondurensis]
MYSSVVSCPMCAVKTEQTEHNCERKAISPKQYFNTVQILKNRPVRTGPGLDAGPRASNTHRLLLPGMGPTQRSSGGEEPSPKIRGIKKVLPQLSAPSTGLSKNISDAAEKTIPPTLDHDQPCDFLKEGSGVNEPHRKSSMDAGPSWTKAPRGKNSLGKRQSDPQAPCVPPRPESSLARVSWPAAEEPGGRISPEAKAERSPLGATGNKLFLAVQSMGILKGDVDEDSASDLSDSERIPIAPSPRTPPDLRLRAEEIDPACFDLDLHPGQGHARTQHCYPDFLPPRCSSWDLRGMAMLVHAERRPGAVPRAGGLLGRYVDRLLQLEWLQIQTVQGERAKGGKARLPAAPGGPLQSPGRGKLLAGAVSRPPQDGAPKSGPARKKGLPRTQGAPSCYPFETPPKPLEVLSGSRLGSQKQTPDVRTEEKKKGTKNPRPPRWHLAGGDGSLAMESSGNIRFPKQPAGTPDSMEARKASKPQAHAHLKKKGNANSCGHASLSGEKKLKTNGGKQNTHTFK